MQLTIRLLGTEILHLSISPEPRTPAPEQDDRGDCTTSPIGFAAPPLLPVREPGWDGSQDA